MRHGAVKLFFFSILTLLLGCNADTSATESEQDMIFKKKPSENYVISSPLKGQLLNAGEPMANTKIIRELEWEGHEGAVIEEYLTDENGFFDLPVHEEALSSGGIGQFVAYTKIFVEHDGNREGVWTSAKTHKGLNSEFDEPPQDLVCDVTTPKSRVEMNHGLCMTRCRWSNMPKDESNEW